MWDQKATVTGIASTASARCSSPKIELKKVGKSWNIKVDGQYLKVPANTFPPSEQIEVDGSHILTESDCFQVKLDPSGKWRLHRSKEIFIDIEDSPEEDEEAGRGRHNQGQADDAVSGRKPNDVRTSSDWHVSMVDIVSGSNEFMSTEKPRSASDSCKGDAVAMATRPKGKQTASTNKTTVQNPKNVPKTGTTQSKKVEELQKELKICQTENAQLRAKFNPDEVRRELQLVGTISQDQLGLLTENNRRLIEENIKLKSGKKLDDRERHTAEIEQLKKDKETAEQEMEDMKNKLEDAGQQLQNIKKEQNSTLQISDESIRKERDKLKADLDDARCTIDTLKKEKSEHEFQISDLKNTCHNAFEKQRKTDVKLEKLIDEHKKLIERKDECTIDTLKKEKSEHEFQISDLKNTCHNAFEKQRKTDVKLEKLIDEHKKLIERKDECTIDTLKKEKSEHEFQISDLKNTCHNAFEKQRKTDVKLEKLIDEHKKLIERKDECTIDTLKKEKSEHEFQISDLKNTCHNAFEKQRKTDVKLEKLIDEHKKLIERKDETIQKLRKENNMVDTAPSGPSVAKVKELEKENHDLKTRLSEMIADLSDENRPQKLGEMYSELYDNEWTDAFEEIQQKKGSEQASIAFLRETLQEAYTFCQKLSSEYRAQVSKGVLTFNSKEQIMDDTKLPPTLKRLLVHLMKKVSPYLKEGVANKFLDKAGNAGDSEKTFRKKCAALCWLMTMQDPAVTLITDSSTREFNTDQFRVYTKRGSTVDYVVWPPLQLHTGGPLIAKGVAQGK